MEKSMAGHLSVKGVNKLGKGNTRGSMVGAGAFCWCRECAFLSLVLLKLCLSMGREEPRDSHPIINECGVAWVVPGQVRVVPEPKCG
jgi:hypothetical protein